MAETQNKDRINAEKDRILILKVEPTCIYRELHETTAGGFTEVDLMCGKQKRTKCDEEHFAKCKCKELNGLSKEEAIERMAKAMAADDTLVEGYYEMAEKGLNALLDTPTLEERVEELVKKNTGIPDYDEFNKALREGK